MSMDTPTLFDLGTAPQRPPDPLDARKKAMRKVLDYAGEKFREAFTAFVIRYLERHGSADGETIREAYEKTTNPKPHKWQAAGGIYAKLRRDGKIEEVGKVRSKKFGNDLAVIALRKNA